MYDSFFDFLVSLGRARRQGAGRIQWEQDLAPTLDLLVFSSSMESKKDHNQLCIQFDPYCFVCSFDTMSVDPDRTSNGIAGDTTKDTPPIVQKMAIQDATHEAKTRLPETTLSGDALQKRVVEKRAENAKLEEELAQQKKILKAWQEIYDELSEEEAESMEEIHHYEQVEEEEESME